MLKFKRLSNNARKPTKSSEKAAGFDLYSAYDYKVDARGKELVKTDLAFEIPDGCYGRIAPRSGLAWKYFIDVGAGVIDADFRGNLAVVVFNFGHHPFNIKAGDKIAQLICERIAYPELKEELDSLGETGRGGKGVVRHLMPV